jgi:diguanylate cyclase (GGDEF)-like protein
MVDEGTLSSVLAEFARTLLTDFPIQSILDHLVERIVDVLPVTGAGVTLIWPGAAPHYVAASDSSALRLEQLQTALGQGPCVAAYTTGEAVAVPDLTVDTRFDDFRSAALAAGGAAVFAFPLRHADERLGALDLYRDVPGSLDARDLAAAQTLADVAAAYLLNAQARAEAQAMSDRFRDRSLHDALTGLPNRALLHQRLEHAAQRAERSHTLAAVLFADLDRFKWINDTYGHAVGDELLVAVGRRLSAVVRPGDTLARVSGDEFVILCEDLAHADDATQLAGRVQETLSRRFHLDDADVSVSASVGIAYCGPGETVTPQLVTHADMAMYQAKRAGGGMHRVLDLRSSSQVVPDPQRRRPAGGAGPSRDLGSDLAVQDLHLEYQPIVRTVDCGLVGVEALLRWTHPRRGAVPALTAVGLAEQHGSIAEIGAWALRRSLVDRQAWLAAAPDRSLAMSVNVSVRQLMSRGFRDTVVEALTSTATDPTALVLEVTEGIFIEDDGRAAAVLTELHDLGVQLALDDFGSGYCSLGYLRRLPVDIVKLDQTFVTDLGHDPVSAAIVEAVHRLAGVLDLRVVAEGVETEQQHDQVVRIGCHLAQGFLYGRPSRAQHIAELLAVGGALHVPQRRSASATAPSSR